LGVATMRGERGGAVVGDEEEKRVFCFVGLFQWFLLQISQYVIDYGLKELRE
jgi:hypothetical protein